MSVVGTVTAVSSAIIASCAVYQWYKLYKEMKLKAHEMESLNCSRQIMHHYGNLKYLPELINVIPVSCESYHDRLAEMVNKLCTEYNVPMDRILDVGSGAGRLSIALSQTFKEVVATDTDYEMNVTTGQFMSNHKLAAKYPSGGVHYSKDYVYNNVPSYEGKKIQNVIIWDEDVCNMSFNSGKFNCIVVSNTLSELDQPEKFLKDVGDYIEDNGLLIISDTYNWKYLYPQPNPNQFGETNAASHQMVYLLRKDFDCVKKAELPFYVPQCERLSLVGNAEVTVWKRRLRY